MTWFEKSILKYILVFLIVFFFGRAVFLLYNYQDLADVSFLEILSTYTKGLRMDMSALSYFSPLALLLLFLYQITKKRVFIIVLKSFLSLAFFAYYAIVFGELSIYDEWMTKLNPKAMSYLSNVSEVWRTATTFDKMLSIVVVPSVTALFIFVMHKILSRKHNGKPKYIRSSIVLVLALAFGFLGARGGFYQIPLSVSGVFFSTNRTVNFATVNSIWNLGYAYYKESKYDEENKYKFYSDNYLDKILKPFKNTNDHTPEILKTKNPNIVLILFESWSADLVDTLDSKHDLMPNWRAIKKEGMNFSRCYATGRHSEEGMLAVLAGYPSLASSYLMGFTDKNAKLETLNKKLSTRDYQQSFFFGGDLGYANIKSFFFQNPFDKISDELSFPTHYEKGKLGYHDDALYAEMFKETKVSKEPFFIGGFTSSTHSPYDAPMGKMKKYADVDNPYMNTAHYADSCLGAFYNECKQQDWFENTLFVMVSDHSHPTPMKRKYCSPESHRIAFMLAGGALKEAYRGLEFNKVISQIDIPATLMQQMSYASDELTYSRNVLDSLYIPFAYFSDKTCQGVVTEDGYARYSIMENKVGVNTFKQNGDSVMTVSRALLQRSYMDFQGL
jgi:phosphoglycerol transferase MdoB-like AlkP superfamily enzyme